MSEGVVGPGEEDKPGNGKRMHVVYSYHSQELSLESETFIKANNCITVPAPGKDMKVDLKVDVGPEGVEVLNTIGTVDLSRLKENSLVKKWRQKNKLQNIYIYERSLALQKIDEETQDGNGLKVTL